MDVLVNGDDRHINLSRDLEPTHNESEREEASRGGSKHANLMRLAKITEGMDGVEVPVSRALFTEDIRSFLEKEAPQVFDNFKRLGDLYLENSTGFFDQAIVKQILSEIQGDIKKAFLRYPVECLPQGIFDHKGYFMVRSSGSEDGKIANAGGNVSIAYVHPDPMEILAAIGEVEASYFSASSLQNRINGGENPFEAPLRFGVLVQPLIGEEVGGSNKREGIPVSMVLFTNEPNYIGGDAFRVMRINAAYGHGEGVVGNKGISQDTIFVLQSCVDPEKIYLVYNNQPKLERLIPVQKGGKIELEPVLNEEGMRELPVLSYEEIKRLFDLGCRVEADYGVPMDMEIVVKNGVIYPVQARPINRKETKPTFVDRSLCKEEEIGEEIRANKVLVPGDLSARLIEPAALLIAPTLEEAEKQFKQGVHQFVVVSQDEPAQSHPVVNFSSMGIPCFYVEDPEKVRGKKLVICVQEGTMAVWKGSDAHLPLKEGYTAHPAPITVSVIDSARLLSVKNVKNDQIPEDLKEAFIGVRNPKTRQAALRTLAQSRFLKKAEEEAKTLKNRVSKMNHVSDDVMRTIDAIEKLAQKVSEATSELFASASKENELEILLHVKVLQQLVMQESGGVGQLSLMRLPQFVTAVHTALDHQQKLSFSGSFTKEALLGHEAVSPRIQKRWAIYLERLENLIHEDPSKAHLGAKLQKLLSIVEKTQSGSVWINLFFAAAFERKSDIEKLTESLLEGFSEESTFLEEMLLCKEKIKNEMANIDNFKQEATFYLAFERLKKLRAFFEGEFVDRFQRASSIEKLIVQAIMQEMIDLFDKTIKTAKMAPFMNEALFKEMVGENFKILDAWRDKGVPNEYLRNLETRIGLANGLLPSSDFSVQAATYGSETALGRHQPKTVEDCFTLVHQNLLGLVQRIGKGFLPQNFKEILNLPETFVEMIGQTELIGGKLARVTMGEGKIRITYNIPLRNHSAALVLEHDLQKNQDTIQVWFYGERRERWDYIAASFEAFDGIGGCKILREPSVTAQEVCIPIEGDFDKLEGIFKLMKLAIGVANGRPISDIYRFIESQLRNDDHLIIWFEKMQPLSERGGEKGKFSRILINGILEKQILEVRSADLNPQKRKEKITELFNLLVKLDQDNVLIGLFVKEFIQFKETRELIRNMPSSEIKISFYKSYINCLIYIFNRMPLENLDNMLFVLSDPIWEEKDLPEEQIVDFFTVNASLAVSSEQVREIWDRIVKMCKNAEVKAYAEICLLKETQGFNSSFFLSQTLEILKRNPEIKDPLIIYPIQNLLRDVSLSNIEELSLFKEILDHLSGDNKQSLYAKCIEFWEKRVHLLNTNLIPSLSLMHELLHYKMDKEVSQYLTTIYWVISSSEEGVKAWRACAECLIEPWYSTLKRFEVNKKINSSSTSLSEKLQLMETLIFYQQSDSIQNIQLLLKQMLPSVFADATLRKAWEILVDKVDFKARLWLKGELLLNYTNLAKTYLVEGVSKHDFGQKEFTDPSWVNFFAMHDWIKERVDNNAYMKEMLFKILPQVLNVERLSELWLQFVSKLSQDDQEACREVYHKCLLETLEMNSSGLNRKNNNNATCKITMQECFIQLRKLPDTSKIDRKKTMAKILPNCLQDEDLRLLWEEAAGNLQNEADIGELYREYLTKCANTSTPEALLALLKHLVDTRPEVTKCSLVKRQIENILIMMCQKGFVDEIFKKSWLSFLRENMKKEDAEQVYIFYLRSVEKNSPIDCLEFLQQEIDERGELFQKNAQREFVQMLCPYLPAICADDRLFEIYEKLLDKVPLTLKFLLLENLVKNHTKCEENPLEEKLKSAKKALENLKTTQSKLKEAKASLEKELKKPDERIVKYEEEDRKSESVQNTLYLEIQQSEALLSRMYATQSLENLNRAIHLIERFIQSEESKKLFTPLMDQIPALLEKAERCSVA